MTVAATAPQDGVLPALKPEVSFTIRPIRGGAPRYLVEDRFTKATYELGEREVFLCRQLDGRTALPDVARRYEESFYTPIGLGDLEAFVRQVGDLGLLVGAQPRARTLPEVFNPEAILPIARIPLLRGDRVLGALARHSSWLSGRPAQVLSGLVILAGFTVMALGWSALFDAVWEHWTPAFLFVVVVVACAAVHTPRAIIHGIASKRYGAQVSGIGLVLLYYVIPWFYCDYTDIVWVRDRSARIRIIAVGLYYQLFVWGLAVLGWALTGQGVANSLWLALGLASALSFLVFTANPLVKMEGYLLLVNWLEVPQLRERALAAAGAWLMRRPSPEVLTRRERRLFVLYGLLCFVYALGHLVLFLTLAGRGLTAVWEAGGAAATVIVALYLVHRPVGRYLAARPAIRWLIARDAGMKRWIWRGGIGLLVLLVLLIPYPYETGGPFTIVPDQRGEVHAEIEGGRIVNVMVREGAAVTAGQPLGQIDPREYERNVVATQAQLDEAQARLRLLKKDLALLQNPPNIETVQGVEAEERRLQSLLADYKKQLELTTLRAPFAGRVTTPQFEQSVGKYLKQGDLFATVEQSKDVQVEVFVPEADGPQVKVGARVRVVPWAYPYETFVGTVKDIAPLALPQPGVATADKTAAKAVRVIAQVPNADLRLKTQLTGYAKIKTETIPLWQVLSRLITRWFAVQFWYWLP